MPVIAYMGHVQDNAEESVRRVITRLENGHFTYPLDSGAKISVAITVDPDAREAVIDFTGTSRQDEGNYNAPASICAARGPLRLPHPGRRRHSDERRLPEAAEDHRPVRNNDQSRLFPLRLSQATPRSASRSPTAFTVRSASSPALRAR